MLITPAEESQITFYFTAQSLFFRSPTGPMLERARCAAFDSSGHRIPRIADQWTVMQTRHAAAEAQGYTVETEQLTRFASVSRRMLAVERASLAAKRVLEAFYGPRGDRWAGFGDWPGRIGAAFMLTPSGDKLLTRDRLRHVRKEKARSGDTWESLASRYCGSPDRADDVRLANKCVDSPKPGVVYGMPSPGHLTPDERLENLLASHKTSRRPGRAALVTASQNEAEAMLRGAWRLWMSSGRRVAA